MPDTTKTITGDTKPRAVRPCHLCGRPTFVYDTDRQSLVCNSCYAPHDPDARYNGRRFHSVRNREMLEHHGLTPAKGTDCVLRLIGKRCKGWPDCPCRIDGGTGGPILDHTTLWRDQDGALEWTSEPYNFRQELLDEMVRTALAPLGITAEVGGYSPWYPEFTTLIRFRAL